jgi:hypothetical protein
MNLSDHLISIFDNNSTSSNVNYNQLLRVYQNNSRDKHLERSIDSQDAFFDALKSILTPQPKILHNLIYEIIFVQYRLDIASVLFDLFGIHTFLSAGLEHRHLIISEETIFFQYLKLISPCGYQDSRYIVVLNLYVQLFPPTCDRYSSIKELYPDWCSYANHSISSSVQKHLRELVRWSIVALGVSDEKISFFKSFSSLDHEIISETDFSRMLWEILLSEASSGQGQGFFVPKVGSISDLLASTNQYPNADCESLHINFDLASNPNLSLSSLRNLRVKKIKNHEKWLSEPLADSDLSTQELDRLDELHKELLNFTFERQPHQLIIDRCLSEVAQSQSIFYRLKVYDLFMLFSHSFMHEGDTRVRAENLTVQISSELISCENHSESKKHDLCRFFLFAARNLQYSSSCAKIIEYVYSGLDASKLGDFTIGFRGDIFSLSRSHLHLLYSVEIDPLLKARKNLADLLSSNKNFAEHVITVYCSQDYVDLFDIWISNNGLGSSPSSSTSIKLVVFCLDCVAKKYLSEKYSHASCIVFLEYFIVSGHYDTYTILFRERLYILHSFVSSGHNTLLCGLDTFISSIDSLLLLFKQYSLVTASDNDIINGDCIYLKSDDSTKIFLDRCLLYSRVGLIDQTALNIALRDFVDVELIRNALRAVHSCVRVNFDSHPSGLQSFKIDALFMGRSMATRSSLFLSKDTLVYQPHVRHLSGPSKAKYMQAILNSENAQLDYRELSFPPQVN